MSNKRLVLTAEDLGISITPYGRFRSSEHNHTEQTRILIAQKKFERLGRGMFKEVNPAS